MKNLLAFVLVGACVPPAVGCDLCAIYAATEVQGGSGKGFFGGVAEQYTYFNTLQVNGREVPNVGNEYLNSSISRWSANSRHPSRQPRSANFAARRGCKQVRGVFYWDRTDLFQSVAVGRQGAPADEHRDLRWQGLAHLNPSPDSSKSDIECDYYCDYSGPFGRRSLS